MTGGYPVGSAYKTGKGVNMYNIMQDCWVACPERKVSGANHSSLCLGRKLYIFFGSHGGMCGVNVPQSSIERMDAQAFVEGQSVQWEMVKMPPESLKLIKCPLITPISEKEIAFLRFGHPESISK